LANSSRQSFIPVAALSRRTIACCFDAVKLFRQSGIGTEQCRRTDRRIRRNKLGCSPADTHKEHPKRTEETPPAGEFRAREGEDFSNDEVDRRQGTLLLPTRGGGDRKARLAVIKSYNPSPALIERAAEFGINALAEDVFGKWQRHRIANDRLPLDHAAAEADFENWIRDEARFAERDAARARSRPQHSTPAEDEAAGRFFDKLRAFRANGAVNG
jgi:hypothetical protein